MDFWFSERTFYGKSLFNCTYQSHIGVCTCYFFFQILKMLLSSLPSCSFSTSIYTYFYFLFCSTIPFFFFCCFSLLFFPCRYFFCFQRRSGAFLFFLFFFTLIIFHIHSYIFSVQLPILCRFLSSLYICKPLLLVFLRRLLSVFSFVYPKLT